MKKLIGVVQQLKVERNRAAKEVERLDAALAVLNGSYRKRTGSGSRMSAAGRARIVAAQKARWAKIKAKNGTPNVARRTLSVAARKRIAAAQRARWAKERARKKAA